MRLFLPLVTFITLFFQACSILPGTYNAGGYGGGGGYYGSYPSTIKVNLQRVTGNDLSFIERVTFIRELKNDLNQRGSVIIGDTPTLSLEVIINKYAEQVKMYKNAEHGFTIYHLDTKYNIKAQYYVTDTADFTPVKGIINYNVTVKAKSAVDYNDAKRVALKKVMEALAKRVANDISAKGSILASRYSIRTPDYKATHNNLDPAP